VLPAERRHVARVLHREGLPAGQVHRHLEADVGDLVAAHAVDLGLQLGEVDVTLPREVALGIVGLVDDHVEEHAARHLLMELGGREVHVPGHCLPFLDHHLGHDVLGGASLVRGDDVLETEDLAEVAHEVLVVVTAVGGVGGVGHPFPLFAAHRRRAAVGQEVDVHVFRLQE